MHLQEENNWFIPFSNITFIYTTSKDGYDERNNNESTKRNKFKIAQQIIIITKMTASTDVSKWLWQRHAAVKENGSFTYFMMKWL